MVLKRMSPTIVTILFWVALLGYGVALWNLVTGHFITAVMWWGVSSATLYKIA
jgi:hypothetical protein